MPIIEVNASGSLAIPAQPILPVLASLPKDAPVTIMLHGYGYAPDSRGSNPHAEILALSPNRRNQRATSWPRRLGFASPDAGLAIAFGWQARGTIWGAYAKADEAGQALAGLVSSLRADHDGPIGLFAHSLGARVALCALPHLKPGDVNRIAALAGAEFRDPAKAALASPAGRAAQFLNVTSRENDVYDFMFETLLAPRHQHGPALGAGLHLPNSVTLQIDCPHHLRALHGLGFRTAPPRHLMCHWSAYQRPGLFRLYRAFMQGDLSLAKLRSTLPGEIAPRWSRMRLPSPPRGPFALQ